MIEPRDMDAPVDSSCLELDQVSQKTRVRLGWSKKQLATNPLVEEGDIEELLKSIERYCCSRISFFEGTKRSSQKK